MTRKCPKCGREFKNQNQDHYCVKPKTIDEYIGSCGRENTGLLLRNHAKSRHNLIAKLHIVFMACQQHHINKLIHTFQEIFFSFSADPAKNKAIVCSCLSIVAKEM